MAYSSKGSASYSTSASGKGYGGSKGLAYASGGKAKSIPYGRDGKQAYLLILPGKGPGKVPYKKDGKAIDSLVGNDISRLDGNVAYDLMVMMVHVPYGSSGRNAQYGMDQGSTSTPYRRGRIISPFSHLDDEEELKRKRQDAVVDADSLLEELLSLNSRN